MSTSTGGWLACHDCDLLHRRVDIIPGAVARCRRCGGALYVQHRRGLEKALALAIAALVLFVVANIFPFLAFDFSGNVTRTTLVTGVQRLWEQDFGAVAMLVLFTAIVVPGLQLAVLLYTLVPVRLGRLPPGTVWAFRAADALTPWGMADVFILGVIVSVVKLADMARIIPGPALWALAGAVLLMVAAASLIDDQDLWGLVEAEA
ncbi:MAG: paraquat-inducible protein A [Gammaproteobacteria bacterium]